MMGLQVWPPPYSAVNDVRKSLPVRDLPSSFLRLLFSFLTNESTAFSAHFSSSSPCFHPSSFFTAGLEKLNKADNDDMMIFSKTEDEEALVRKELLHLLLQKKKIR